MPTNAALMGHFAWVKFLPSHFMLAFEETFYIGFFEQASLSGLFNPLTKQHMTRYVAYHECNPLNALILDTKKERIYQAW